MSISELFLFSANSKEGLIEALKHTEKSALTILDSKMADFSKFVNSKINFDYEFKAALVAKDGDDLRFLLEKLLNKISATEVEKNDLPIYFSNSKTKPKLALLFPPQGCQKINSAQILIKRFPWAKEISEKIDKELLEKLFCEANSETEKELTKSENAQPAIILSSLLWLEFLKKLGIKADIVAGHSLGELMALYEIKAFNIDELITTTILRGQAMGNTKVIGGMIGLFCDEEKAKRTISGIKDIQIANLNAPNQTVLSGSNEAIKEIEKKAKKHSVDIYNLQVGNAFHSKLMIGAANYFSENFKANKKFTPLSSTFFSSINGKKIDDEINLKQHLGKQITSTVRFIDMIKEIEKETSFAIEVGPGKTLKHLVEKISDKISCCNVESDIESFFDFNNTLANLFIRNFTIDLDELYKERQINEFEAPEAETPTKDQEFCIKESEVINPKISDIQKEETIIAPEPTNINSQDFEQTLKEFAQKNSLDLPVINTDCESEFNIETISYRTDYQWSGLLNGYSKNFLKLAEITEKNAAGTIILVIEEAVSKSKLFHDQEKLQINLLNNDQSHFLFRISNNENHILLITKIFSGTKNDKKVISILVKEKKAQEPLNTDDSGKEAESLNTETKNETSENITSQEKNNEVSNNEEIKIITNKIEEKTSDKNQKNLIHTAIFSASINDINSIGSTYHQWQSEIFAEFIHKTDSEFFKNPNQKFSCNESSVKIFADLQPFDKIIAKLYIENCDENNLELSCNFYPEKTEERLAEARQKMVFMCKNNAKYEKLEIPKQLKSCLVR